MRERRAAAAIVARASGLRSALAGAGQAAVRAHRASCTRAASTRAESPGGRFTFTIKVAKSCFWGA
eukprot:1955089-Prymnesium_polylepis.1